MISLYRCEGCGQVWETYEKCKECEEGHYKWLEIFDVVPVIPDSTDTYPFSGGEPLPSHVFLTFSRGFAFVEELSEKPNYLTGEYRLVSVDPKKSTESARLKEKAQKALADYRATVKIAD